MHCLGCRYNLDGVTGVCPECGRPFDRRFTETYGEPGRATGMVLAVIGVGLLPIPVAALSFHSCELWVDAIYARSGAGVHIRDAYRRGQYAIMLVHFVLLPAAAALLLYCSARRARRRGAARGAIWNAIAVSVLLLFVPSLLGSFAWIFMRWAEDF